ncbi:MAG: ABC transporter substrate-binding protein [Gammaproteobacteria bacterium]|nr:ABC transporter substrate-binding protein [Gammaproteobacteria bacterium]
MHVIKTSIVGLALALSVTSVAAQSPNAVIQGAISELEAGLDGRKEELTNDRAALHALIDDILLPRFDRKYAAQLVLGKHWRTADSTQRERFINSFYNSLLGKYADGVLEFEPDRIEVLSYRGDPTKKRTMVRTIVTLSDGARVPVNYGMVMRASGWLMFDVTVEGVSYIRNYRTELDAEVRSSSLDAVIARFESEAGIVNGE